MRDRIENSPESARRATLLTSWQREQLQALSRPDTLRWLVLAGRDWGIIVLMLVLVGISRHPLVVVFAALVIGSRQHALAILGHDGAHGTASGYRRLNDLLTGMFCFWPMGIALGGYRRFHFAHHLAVGSDRDPELQHKCTLQEWGLPLQPVRQCVHLALDLAGGGLPHFAMIAYLMRPISFRDAMGPLSFWVVMLTALWSAGMLWVVHLWWGSALTGMWLAFRLRIWTEHVGTHASHRLSARWWQRAWFLPNHTYMHWEHHLWPRIPVWHLPAARRLFADPPVMTLGELYRFYRSALPLASGALYAEPEQKTAKA